MVVTGFFVLCMLVWKFQTLDCRQLQTVVLLGGCQEVMPLKMSSVFLNIKVYRFLTACPLYKQASGVAISAVPIVCISTIKCCTGKTLTLFVPSALSKVQMFQVIQPLCDGLL